VTDQSERTLDTSFHSSPNKSLAALELDPVRVAIPLVSTLVCVAGRVEKEPRANGEEQGISE